MDRDSLSLSAHGVGNIDAQTYVEESPFNGITSMKTLYQKDQNGRW